MNKENSIVTMDIKCTHLGGFDAGHHRELLHNAQRALSGLPDGHPQRAFHQNVVDLCRRRLAEYDCPEELEPSTVEEVPDRKYETIPDRSEGGDPVKLGKTDE